MTAEYERILPREEWHRLAHTDIQAVRQYVNPDDMEVCVVENALGDIIACWAVIRIVHLEGVWIHPDYRFRPSIARKLLKSTLAMARRWSPRWIMSAARKDDDHTKRLLVKHLGAIAVDMDPYVLSLDDERVERLCQ